MAQSVIGALRVNLGIDSALFSKGLRDADSGLKRFASQAKIAGAAVAAAMTAAAGALAYGVQQTLKEADDLTKLSRSIGIPVEELSRLKHAADLSGVSLSELSTSVGRLSRNMSDVAQGAGAEAKRAFDQLGISVKNADGTLKSATQIMGEISDRFARMEDGTQKTALSMQIFGRSGATMISLLNAGSAGLRSMTEEADRLGIVIDQKTGEAAERFNDNLTRLGRIKDGIITKISAHLVPALETLSQRLIDAANNSDIMKGAADALTKGIKFTVEAAYAGILIYRQLAAEFVALKNVWNSPDWESLKANWAEFNRVGKDSEALMANLGKRVKEIWDVSREQQMADATRRLAEAMSPVREAFRGTVVDSKAAAAAQREYNATMEEGRQLIAAMRTPAEAYAAEIERLNRLMQAGAIDADTYARAVAQAQDDLDRTGVSSRSAGDAIRDSLRNAFDSAIEGSFKLRDALAGLLKDLAKLAANKLLKTLLGDGTAGGGGGLLGVALKGLKLPGLATGGSFKVGGAGGVDSQLVAFRASPNETVDVRKPGQDGGGGGNTHVTVGVDVDQSGNLVPFVTSIAEGTQARANAAMARSLRNNFGQLSRNASQRRQGR